MREDHSLIIKDLSKAYQLKNGNFVNALDNVSLEIKKGDKWGVIGKNGSGKSTLLSILASIIKPSNGEVVLNGSLSHILDVGSNFIADLTGRENVIQFLKLQGQTKEMIAEKIPAIEEFAGIKDYFDEAIKTYSSGMFLRLAFSTVIQLKSDILIVDEVFNAGDASFREKLKRHFKENMGSDTTVLLASHNPEEISEFCTHCIWLENGKVQEKGSTGEVLKKYYHQLAKEHSIKTSKDQLVKNKEGLQTSISNLHNDFLELKNFSTSPPSGHNEINYDSGVLFYIDIYKKLGQTTLHPHIILMDYQQKPIMNLFPIPGSKLDKLCVSMKDYIGPVKYEAILPRGMLTQGHYYAKLAFGKNVDLGKDFNEEVSGIAEKIFIEIKRNEEKEFLGRTENVFIQPEIDWECDYK